MNTNSVMTPPFFGVADGVLLSTAAPASMQDPANGLD